MSWLRGLKSVAARGGRLFRRSGVTVDPWDLNKKKPIQAFKNTRSRWASEIIQTEYPRFEKIEWFDQIFWLEGLAIHLKDYKAKFLGIGPNILLWLPNVVTANAAKKIR